MFLRDVGIYPHVHTSLQPRSPTSTLTFSPPWERESSTTTALIPSVTKLTESHPPVVRSLCLNDTWTCSYLQLSLNSWHANNVLLYSSFAATFVRMWRFARPGPFWWRYFNYVRLSSHLPDIYLWSQSYTRLFLHEWRVTNFSCELPPESNLICTIYLSTCTASSLEFWLRLKVWMRFHSTKLKFHWQRKENSTEFPPLKVVPRFIFVSLYVLLECP